MDQALRLRALLSDTGLCIPQAAKLLHVTPRTVQHWLSGKYAVPYAAYKLLRVMRLFELPCAGWDGWHMHSGKLWSPEGFGFVPHDSNWWGLLVRKAHHFGQMVERERQMAMLMHRIGPGSAPAPGNAAEGAPLAGNGPQGRVTAHAPTGAAGRAAQPPGLDLSLGHFATQGTGRGVVTEEKRPVDVILVSGQRPLTSGKGRSRP